MFGTKLSSGCSKDRQDRAIDSCYTTLCEGALWICHPGREATKQWAKEVAPLLRSAAKPAITDIAGESHPDSRDVENAILGKTSSAVQVLRPEQSAELKNCKWDGDGHFNMAHYPGNNLPTLGQVVTYVRQVTAAAEAWPLTVHITAEARMATGAVLAGAVLVLARGKSAQKAWVEVLRGCVRPPSSNPQEAWDRFPSPFSPIGTTGETSLTVLDCLAGLQAARDLGWLKDYRSFDIEAWSFLRQKFDASWVIPNEMLALGDPQLTAMNPRFPGLDAPLETGEILCDSVASTEASTPHAVSLEEADLSDCEPDMRERKGPTSMPRGGSWAENPKDTFPTETCLLKQESFASHFVRMGISRIARLNHQYECKQVLSCPTAVTDTGVKVMHYEFQDGSIPTKKLLKAFLNECQSVSWAPLAVHCKAGLGRTGIMVGAYAVAQHNIDGKAFHGWVRLCRPGSVQTTEQERFLRALKPGAAGWTSPFGCFGTMSL
mmetsp:Transcript_30097/g.83013  ORF Transcript_30097/g.83013 Transcript_30097/m.83013 type:complete len:491 (-) Transcript_30097:233-1705(-)